MSWKNPSWNLTKFFKKKSSSSDLNEKIESSGVFEFSFTCIVNESQSWSTREIKILILQNPWSALNKTPSITTIHTESGDEAFKISFQALTRIKGKMIEESIRRHLSLI
ncbi:MAG: hypothetical protein ACJA08_000589 [Cyclobacteriaceae bacterium]|jgi:hypothetical protein